MFEKKFSLLRNRHKFINSIFKKLKFHIEIVDKF